MTASAALSALSVAVIKLVHCGGMRHSERAGHRWGAFLFESSMQQPKRLSDVHVCMLHWHEQLDDISYPPPPP